MPPSPLATLLGPALGQSRGRLALAAAGLGLAQACFLLLPLQLKPLAAALDSSASAAESRRLLRTGCSRMVALYLLRVVLNHGGKHCLDSAGDRALLSVRSGLFAAMQRLDLEEFETIGDGVLSAKLQADAAALRDVVTVNAERVLQGLLYVVGGIFLCLWISAFLTAVIFASIVPIGLATVLLRGFSERSGQRLSESGNRVLDRARRVLAAQRTVRSAKKEDFEAAAYRGLGEQFVAESARYSAVSCLVRGCTGLSHSAALMAIIYFGVANASNNGLSSGELVALINLLVEIGKHLETAVQNYLLIAQASGKAAGLVDIIDRSKAAGAGGAVGELSALEWTHSLRFCDCSYRYPSCEREGEGGGGVVDVSFNVAPGELVLLVGPSGSGKSTLLDLVAKFRDVQAGAVTVGGMDVGSMSFDLCRSLVCWVGQHSTMVPGTIRGNVVYGVPFATDTEVEEALEAAACDFIDEGNIDRAFEKGFALSGGQQARVALARGLLQAKKTASVLLLDEPCAALDAESEAHVLASVSRIVETHKLACLLVTHRLQHAAEVASRIVCLKDGKVVEAGTHAELLGRGGLYSSLYRLQHPDGGGG